MAKGRPADEMLPAGRAAGMLNIILKFSGGTYMLHTEVREEHT